MCHLLLLAPVFGLVLFLIFPWPIALPVYLLIAIASAFLFYKVVKVMKMPVYVGQEAMLGQEVKVVAPIGTPSAGQYLVRQRGELWSAACMQQLRRGDRAVITGFEGSRPRIQPMDTTVSTAAIAMRGHRCH